MVEVIEASVHPSDDPLKIKTKPSDYFFVVRLLDNSFLKDLETLTRSKIEFTSKKVTSEIGRHKIFAIIELNDCRNKNLTKLIFTRNFDVYFDDAITILYVIILAFITNLVVNLI